MITVSCKTCSKEFQTKDSPSRAGRGKYCSKVCYYESKKGKKGPWAGKSRSTPWMIGENNHAYGKSPWNKGKKLPQTTGVNNHRWIEDRTALKTDRRHAYDSRYREWMKQVRNRDGWTCQMSNGDCSGRIETHHILSWRSHPELRYDVKNGITLCHYHHPRAWEEEERMAPIFLKKTLWANAV